MGFYIVKTIGGLLIQLKCNSVWGGVLEESKRAALHFTALLWLVDIRDLDQPIEGKDQLPQ